MGQDRESVAHVSELITDPDLKAKKEVENGFAQLDLANAIIRSHIHDEERPFSLRPYHLLKLNSVALQGIHTFAGTYRNGPVEISESQHTPPECFMVSEEVEKLCQYVNDGWNSKSPTHLAAYVLWRLNWIHPFADGNGRTSRAASYIVLNIKLDSLLPGKPTVPDQITDDKRPYYDALEAADSAFKATGAVDVSALEEMISTMLAKQLLNAVKMASASAAATKSNYAISGEAAAGPVTPPSN